MWRIRGRKRKGLFREWQQIRRTVFVKVGKVVCSKFAQNLSPPPMPDTSPLRLFIIYAREDQPELLELKAHLRRLLGIALLSIALLIPKHGLACICFGEERAEKNLETSDAVFIGVLTQIVHTDSLFYADWGRQPNYCYFNFKVLHYRKGLRQGSDYVSVFDDVMSNCAGFLRRAKVGDTLLVFAHYAGDNFGPQFLQGNQCTRYAFISRVHTTARDSGDDLYLNESETALINDHSQWKQPYDKEEFLPKKKTEAPKPPETWWNMERIILAISLLLNLFLLFKTVRRNSVPAPTHVEPERSSGAQN